MTNKKHRIGQCSSVALQHVYMQGERAVRLGELLAEGRISDKRRGTLK